ncbi:protoporphyrinogen oxidase [Cokeromyces recurvatus]|uniref:protoporphyrinogen oxidase n=1 Tax=Cokeromyces recurvatus TaxID=90255 RepID=UPI00222064DA|nr:protoporphyrinogen oxidase [Cokeromyces recurvatus]KAI7904351.1 protoporphyrinogen oxidase [Cokeromyces recurvatus]
MTSVAVLGGGISGLSTAYYLSRLAPKSTKIILIEGKDRVGGWIQSRRVSPGKYDSKNHLPKLSQEDDSILFEAGPRSLRPEGPNGVILLEMLQHLQLNKNESLLCIPKSDPSVRHRYIYYDDKINTLPTGPMSLLFNKPPVFKSVILAGALEPFRSSRFKNGIPKDGKEDESLYDFMKRRFNEHTAINLMGALAHGIYAGDVKQLSLKSTMRMLYEAERNYGGVIMGMLRGTSNTATMRERGMVVRARNQDPEWFSKMEKMSILGFKDGMETLPNQIRAWLEQCPNVDIIINDPVESIEVKSNGKETKIKTKSTDIYADHVISTIPSINLDKLLKEQKLPHLTYNPSVDVAVVNFAYPSDVKLGYDGFGILTPHRDTKHPISLPGTLGVVFDSNTMPGLETIQSDTVKVTAMIGGSDWKDAFGKITIDELDPEIAYKYANDVMNVFLNINSTPTHSMVNLQKQCIPQYLVGHEARLRELHHALKDKYGHLMSVTGASYLSVSVPGCIKNSRMLVEELLVSGALGSREKIVTGLGNTVKGTSTEEMKDSARLSKGNINIIMKS